MKLIPMFLSNFYHFRIIADDCKPIATALRRSKSIREVYLGGNPLMPDDQTLFISILKSKTPIEILSLGDYTFITQETNQVCFHITEQSYNQF